MLVVLSDQQRPDSCGVFGQQLPVTPRLDALADDGVAFHEAFTVQPVCGPARAAIQTGLYPTTTGCWRNGIALPPEGRTLAERMSSLGYQTGYIGKWHLASNRGRNLPDGRETARFERLPVPPERRGGYHDVWVAADALEHTSGATSGDPATNLDLLPTIVTAAGGDDPHLDGRPLQNEGGPAVDVLVQISESQIGRALRTPTHTFAAAAPTRNPLAGHLRPAADRYVGTHLYDNRVDPHQLHNLIDDTEHGPLRRQLAARLADRIHEVEHVRPEVT